VLLKKGQYLGENRMAHRKIISSGSPYEASIGFSRASRIGNIISVAGTAPIAADGSTAAPGDVYSQTCRCLEIIESAIQQAGANLSNVIRTRVMLTDISRWEEAGRAHGEFFGDVRPACTFVEVSAFIKEDWLVEVEADCVMDD
jgi:enamine deaminase RidA (YjgF/YER057c/UK114 family)